MYFFFQIFVFISIHFVGGDLDESVFRMNIFEQKKKQTST